MAQSFCSRFAMIVIALSVLPTALSAVEKNADPCSLLTPAEIQAVVGKPVKAGTPKIHSNPAAGADCTYVVGDFGSLNLLVKPLQSYDTPERTKAAFAKMKMTPTDLPNVGDAAFFTSPGFEMVQLHAFKGEKYALITLLVPGLKEASVRPMAGQLMKTAVSRIK